jgi:anti-sigma factor ChrR (cupin superfamily)
MDRGTSYPPHRHADVEECYVLQGDLRVAGRVLRAGDYQRADRDSVHGVQSTENGCLLLIVSSTDDELL